MMPERIWAHRLPVGLGYIRKWDEDRQDYAFTPEADYIRADIHDVVVEAARREERGWCKGIAEQWGRYHNDLWNESRLDPKKVGRRSYYDGASDCANEIANEISETSTGGNDGTA